MPRFYYTTLLIRRNYLYKDHFVYSADNYTKEGMNEHLKKQIEDLNTMVAPEDRITIVPDSARLQHTSTPEMDELYRKPILPKMELPGGKYIKFEDTSIAGNKTKMFLVINNESEETIGLIKWYGAFRKYSFFPNANTVFENKCLRDITVVLEYLMEQHKLLKDLDFVPSYMGTTEELNKLTQNQKP